MHDRSSHGIGLSSFEGGSEGGPVCLFEDGRRRTNAVVLSSASNFTNAIFSIRTRRSMV